MALPTAGNAVTRNVRYPEAQHDVDRYYIDVLRLALRKTGTKFSLQGWPGKFEKDRALRELEQGRHLDVEWAVTTEDRERRLLPVRIPLDKGLAGLRLALIRRDSLPTFARIENVAQLAALEAGQGFDWPDTAVLRANHFRVRTGRSDGLAQMLASGRFDYYPRSVRQIWAEASTLAAQGLVIEPGVAIYYPSAVYFFVHRSDRALAASLEKGLKTALQDGSFDKLFWSHFEGIIEQASLPERKIFMLKNPVLPSGTPLHVKHYWFDVARAAKQ